MPSNEGAPVQTIYLRVPEEVKRRAIAYLKSAGARFNSINELGKEALSRFLDVEEQIAEETRRVVERNWRRDAKVPSPEDTESGLS